MKIDYINPFIESVYELFSTMLSATVERGKIDVSRDSPYPDKVTALIGLSGQAHGSVALSFPKDTALAMVNKLLETDTREIDETVSDGIAELVNIVAGGAKAKFTLDEGQELIDLSMPTVVRGTRFNVDYPSESPWVEIPFESSLGGFSLRITYSFDDATTG